MAALTKSGLVHRDLAARNILVFSKGVPKIADFGLTRTLHDGLSGHTEVRTGPIRWMSKEALRGFYGEFTDVWSFGALMWEVMERKVPFSHLTAAGVVALVLEGGHPEISPKYPRYCQVLMSNCFAPETTQRPTFWEIHEFLKQEGEKQARSGWDDFRTPAHGNYEEVPSYPPVADNSEDTSESPLPGILGHWKEDLFQTTAPSLAVDREEELRFLRQQLSFPFRPEVRIICIRGPRGVGKTALLRAVASRMTGQGYNAFGISLSKKSPIDHSLFHQFRCFDVVGPRLLDPCPGPNACELLFAERFQNSVVLLDDLHLVPGRHTLVRQLKKLPPMHIVISCDRTIQKGYFEDVNLEFVDLEPKGFLACKLLGLSLDQLVGAAEPRPDTPLLQTWSDVIGLFLERQAAKQPAEFAALSRKLAQYYEYPGRPCSPENVASLWEDAGEPSNALRHLHEATMECKTSDPMRAFALADRYMKIMDGLHCHRPFEEWAEVILLWGESHSLVGRAAEAQARLANVVSSTGLGLWNTRDWTATKWERRAAKTVFFGIKAEMEVLRVGVRAGHRARILLGLHLTHLTVEWFSHLRRAGAATHPTPESRDQLRLSQFADTFGFILSSYLEVQEASPASLPESHNQRFLLLATVFGFSHIMSRAPLPSDAKLRFVDSVIRESEDWRVHPQASEPPAMFFDSLLRLMLWTRRGSQAGNPTQLADQLTDNVWSVAFQKHNGSMYVMPIGVGMLFALLTALGRPIQFHDHLSNWQLRFLQVGSKSAVENLTRILLLVSLLRGNLPHAREYLRQHSTLAGDMFSLWWHRLAACLLRQEEGEDAFADLFELKDLVVLQALYSGGFLLYTDAITLYATTRPDQCREVLTYVQQALLHFPVLWHRFLVELMWSRFDATIGSYQVERGKAMLLLADQLGLHSEPVYRECLKFYRLATARKAPLLHPPTHYSPPADQAKHHHQQQPHEPGHQTQHLSFTLRPGSPPTGKLRNSGSHQPSPSPSPSNSHSEQSNPAPPHGLATHSNSTSGSNISSPPGNANFHIARYAGLGASATQHSQLPEHNQTSHHQSYSHSDSQRQSQSYSQTWSTRRASDPTAGQRQRQSHSGRQSRRSRHSGQSHSSHSHSSHSHSHSPHSSSVSSSSSGERPQLLHVI